MGLTIIELAKKAKISKSTVHRVLSGHPAVSDDVRKEVLALAKKHHYQPNVLARGLRQQKTNTLGVIIDDVGISYYGEVVRGIEDAADERGYSIMLCNSCNEPSREEKQINKLIGHKVDGVLIVPVNKDGAIHKNLERADTPFVLFNEMADIETDYVLSDDVSGAYDAVKYLLELGHRRIGVISFSDPEYSYQIQSKLQGYQRALAKFDIEFDPALVADIGPLYSSENVYGGMMKLLALQDRPTAIFAFSDTMAVMACRALDVVGLKLVHDISVVGYDDSEIAKLMGVPLTTVATPKSELGKTAVELLMDKIDKIENNGVWEPRKIFLKPELVVRESCRAIIQQ